LKLAAEMSGVAQFLMCTFLVSLSGTFVGKLIVLYSDSISELNLV